MATPATAAATATTLTVRGDGSLKLEKDAIARCHSGGCGSSEIAVYRFLRSPHLLRGITHYKCTEF